MRDIQFFIKKEFLLLLLFLIFFFDFHEKGYYMCFILAIYFFFLKFSSLVSSLDTIGISLVLFSFTYSVFYTFNTEDRTSMILVYVIAPLSFYGIGKYFSMNYRSYNIYYFLFLFLSLGYSFIPAISILNNIIENGFIGERDVRLLTRNDVTTATILGSYFTMNMAIIGTIFVKSTQKIENRIKFISLGAFIISLLCVLRVASRTQLGIALISLLATLTYLMFKQSFNKNIRFVLKIAIPLIVIFFSISSDSAVFNILEQRNNDEEQLVNANGRTELWKTSLNNLVSKPFGWEISGDASDISSYSHNMWLDVDRVTGIIPFIFLIIFTISCIKLLLKTLKVALLNLYFNTTILILFLGFMAVFFVEPILVGFYYLFLIFCLFIGVLSGYVKADLFYKNRLRKHRYINLKYKNENSNHII